MRFATFTAFALAFIPLISAAALSDNVLSLCQAPEVVTEGFIGADKNVKVQTLKCANTLHERETSLEKRQAAPIDVCGAECQCSHIRGPSLSLNS